MEPEHAQEVVGSAQGAGRAGAAGAQGQHPEEPGGEGGGTPSSTDMARPRAGRWRRWGPYAGLLVTAAMMTISSNIAQSSDGARGAPVAVIADDADPNSHHRYFARHVADYNPNTTIPSSTSLDPNCANPVPDDAWMGYIQRGRQREMWSNCNRCATTAAPVTLPHAVTSHSPASPTTPCSWRKKQLVPELLSNLLVDDKHKVMYCVIPKVACTNWKRALVRMSGRINDTKEESLRMLSVHDELFLSQIGLRYLNTYPLPEIRRRMETYYKFMFVRHPLERLLSAYMEKFTTHNQWTEHFQRKYGRRIVKTFRRSPSAESLARGHDVTFAEFVKYIIKRSAAGKMLNPHWASYYDLCQPCSIKYDFVGKFESFETDSSYMLGKISGDHCPHAFPTIKPAGAATREIMHKYYSSVPQKDVARLIQAYLPDFMMFGYDINFSAYLSS